MFNFLRNLFKSYDDGIKVKIIDLPDKQRSVFDILNDPPELFGRNYIVRLFKINQRTEFF